jgi:glycosyltransferase involved in cell wall biosynthesis
MNREIPLVSVEMITYNHAKYIGVAIDSVLNQTYENFELIIIDNFSEDNTEEVVRSYADKRIKYFKFRNYGVIAASRNFGVKKSKGEYIAILDSDDKWYPSKLEKTMEVFLREPDIDLVCHDEYVTSGGKILKTSSYGPYVDDMYAHLLYQGNCISTSATVVKRKRLVEAGLFSERPDFLTVEDYDLWLKLANLGCKFYFLHEVLGEYVLHESNLSANLELHYSNLLTVVENHFRALAQGNGLEIGMAFRRRLKIKLAFIRDLLKNRQYLKASCNMFKLPFEVFKSY